MSELEHKAHVFRTSPERTWKMMAITLGICIVGGAIFFGMWDYWLSSIPAAAAGGVEVVAPATFTGKEIPISMTFIESSDFRTLAFNALPGDPNNNPTIRAEVGDKILFDIKNVGVSFHAFGVTQQEEGFSGIIPGSAIATASNPLKPGEEGKSEFIAGQEGVYYYICTVPGHREQGMVGKILVGQVSEEPVMAQKMEPESKPEPAQVEPAVTVSTPKVDTMPKTMEPFSGTISVPLGSSVPGCEATNECYIPADVSISVGETITWSNDDTAAHTVTSGSPANGPDGNFDSSLFMAGTTFSNTFDSAGNYPYYCMVHPWMTGKVQVG